MLAVTPRPPCEQRAGTTGLEPAPSRPDNRALSPLSYAPEERWKAGSAPRNRRQRRCRRAPLRRQLLPIGTPASACPRRHLLTGWPWRLVEASCTLGPMLCIALVPSLPRPARRQAVPRKWRGWDSNPRSRAHEAREDSRSSTAHAGRSGRQDSNLRSPVPETGGVAKLPHSQMTSIAVPPAGLEPAASGLRARRHRPSTTGAESSGGRDRTCASRLTAARLAARPHRNEDGGSRIRTSRRRRHRLRVAVATARRPLGHAEAQRRSGRIEASSPEPTRFEAGYRRMAALPRSATGARNRLEGRRRRP